MTLIDVDTKMVGLLGCPLGHSFSPAMHNKAFQTLGLNYVYLPIEVTLEGLKDVVAGISRMNFAGFNVTIPHKINVMAHLDRIDELARIIGAVNTVTVKDGVLTGYNTDGEGFVRSLEVKAGISLSGKSCFILGCGGAARAIAMTMAFRGAGDIFICNRTGHKARDLVDEINAKVRPCGKMIPYDPVAIKAAVRQVDILVNTTSVGMHPDEGRMPIDGDAITGDLIVCDIVYNPARTQLLKTAEGKGCKVIPGLPMLVYQGAEGFRLWTGLEPPVDVMFEVVEAAKG